MREEGGGKGGRGREEEGKREGGTEEGRKRIQREVDLGSGGAVEGRVAAECKIALRGSD